MPFRIGQIVALRADATRQGPVIEVLPPLGGATRYRVFHGPEIRDYLEDQLVAAEAVLTQDPLLGAAREARWLSSSAFKARLTSERLATPQTDSIYALHAARIRYIPFQFKPLLRMLRADRPRLLVADDVGVGKTIEAGLILKELQARGRLDRVLVLCPKALVRKWIAELRRFDEAFRPLTSESLRYCLKETQLDGIWPADYARAVGHFELLRLDEIMQGTEGKRSVPGLLTLDPPPRFDLVIVDEAHHLRNPGTNAHALARFLCDVSEAVVFLSATPVHLGSQNLYTLLNLLRPDMFPDAGVFSEMLEPNRHLTSAMRCVRSRKPDDTWAQDAKAQIDMACETRWGRQVLASDPTLVGWRARLAVEPPPSDADRIRCVRDLEETHTLAHVMNRTRRRDIGPFTIREPHTVAVPFTPAQQVVYEAVIGMRREALSNRYGPLIARFLTDTLERQAASCLPALMTLIAVATDDGRWSGICDDTDDVERDQLGLPSDVASRARELAKLVAELPPEDPKLERFLSIVSEALSGMGPRKVLVFSFFLHTLSYLEAALRARGVRVSVVKGDVPDEERELRRDRFRLPHAHPDAIDVLLSSEVGCEGLDYEFCDRLVNYDIPWNPMRIEQRIGRIDRMGQASPKVLIYNFITPGTVEERIFFRCFERLGVFRDSVGDLEEILGELVSDLNRTLLDPTLSPLQVEVRARQLEDNLARRIEEQRRLEEENAAWLGLDQVFATELEDLTRQGRVVSPDDVRHLVTHVLEEMGCRLAADADDSRIVKLRAGKEVRAGLADAIRLLGRRDATTQRFLARLEQGEAAVPMTFDPALALEDRAIAFVTPVHALARVAVARLTQAGRDPLVSRFSVVDRSISRGTYAFAFDLWESIGLRPEVRLVGTACAVGTTAPAPALGSALMRLLRTASADTPSSRLDDQDIERAFHQLEEQSNALRLEELTAVRERNDGLADRRLASLDSYLASRLRRVDAELSVTREDRIGRMKRAERTRLVAEHARRRSEIEARREADVLTRRIAAGVIEVNHGE